MESFIVLATFFCLSVAAFVIRRYGTAEKEDSKKDDDSKKDGQLTKLRSLQLKFFSAYFPAILGDWLQGPYVYQLYMHYGFKETQIAVLFITGFASSSTFGTFTGPLADKFGRRRMTLVFATLYALCCVIKFSSNFWVLMIGRLMGGISTSLLYSVFESWYVRQHLDVEKLPPESGFRVNLVTSVSLSLIMTPRYLLADTFATSSFANGLLAIIAGIVANFLAESLSLGPLAPFAMAVPCFMVCFLVVLITWEENFGDRSSDLIASYRDGALLIWRNRPILYVGLVQSIVESCMYIFVFLWTPVLSLKGESAPLGMIFSCFMVAIMIGSGFFSVLLGKSSRTPGDTLQLSATIFAFCTFICSFSASPVATNGLRMISFTAFLILEASIGLYFPSIGCLRGQLIPEDQRATVTNWFRVPMNLITCFTLLAVNHPQVAADKRSIFATCTALLITGTIVAAKFNTWHRLHHQQKEGKKQS